MSVIDPHLHVSYCFSSPANKATNKVVLTVNWCVCTKRFGSEHARVLLCIEQYRGWKVPEVSFWRHLVHPPSPRADRPFLQRCVCSWRHQCLVQVPYGLEKACGPWLSTGSVKKGSIRPWKGRMGHFCKAVYVFQESSAWYKSHMALERHVGLD